MAVITRAMMAAALTAAMAGGAGRAQGPAVVVTMPAAPLLPRQFGGWVMDGAAMTGTDAAAADGERAGVLKEDGLSQFSAARYARGGAVLEVRALQFADATGAAAAFSVYRAVTPGLRPLGTGPHLGPEAAAGAEAVLFRNGNSVVLARSSRVTPGDLEPLAIGLPKVGGPRSLPPMLPTLLPGKALEPESVRYAVGPAGYAAQGGVLPTEILGFDKSAEAVTASYTERGGKETVTLLLYPTPQIAGDRGRAVEGWINGHLAGLGTVKLRREGPLVLMAAGVLPGDEAQRMVENIHLRSEVTWEKPMPPEFHSEVRKTYSLLTSIAVLSGVLMAAAVLLGLFLGFGRASIRVWMGKPAAVEAEFLGLGLKPGPAARIVSGGAEEAGPRLN